MGGGRELLVAAAFGVPCSAADARGSSTGPLPEGQFELLHNDAEAVIAAQRRGST